MSKYCCFFCPAKDYSEKTLTDQCPSCRRTYGFVLDNAPKSIGEYSVIRELSRGFYGATYVAERGRFKTKVVLKITPVDFYTFFNKAAFEEETDRHSKLAQNANHVIRIDDTFDTDVQFSDDDATTLRCHVAILEYVDGEPLRKYIEGMIPIGSIAIWQIAVDLLNIRSQFEANSVNHNDLHAENLILERLPHEARRPDAIDGTLRVRVIDLGSLSDESKSSNERKGDLHFIARHILQLLERLLVNPLNLEDRDYRIALTLQGIANTLLSNVENSRLPSTVDLVEQIRDAYFRAAKRWTPWKNPLVLRGIGDHYNTQTLESWHVPKLLVDPENKWLTEVSKPGPEIITGMRGCGKTMLLRALDIHARAAGKDGESAADTIARVKNDRFIGLFLSAQRLLDLGEESSYSVEHRATRLFVGYALQAVRALLHLRDIDGSILLPGAHLHLAGGIADFLVGAEELRQSPSLEDLEVRLERILVLTHKDDGAYTIGVAPAQVFPHLAERLRDCSEALSSSTVFYLLDDISTRYLGIDKIEELLSALLFQSPVCAFKFTSEWQTIELGLNSPGRIHPIQIDRDISVFDLGADVFEKINKRGKNNGNDFVAQILQQRATYHASHPQARSPRELLGNVSLVQIAREIASSDETSNSRKHVYRGLSCLTSVCVGDIGDIIKLYEDILSHASGKSHVPIDSTIQADCYQNLCSRRLYDLNRRNGYFKSHALGFAQAAHKLLVRSHKISKELGGGAPRLRQYSSVYVRVTSEETEVLEQQIDKLRALINAGVFVYAGGTARTKTRDSNPIQQFKLSYRKIYGLAAYIGLSDRDRFELSGDDLEEWLNQDTATEEILMRNQIRDDFDADVDETEEEDFTPPSEDPSAAEGDANPASKEITAYEQQSLFTELFSLNDNNKDQDPVIVRAKGIDVKIDPIQKNDLESLKIGGVLTGLGFEDRTLASNEFLASAIRGCQVYAVRYSTEGHSVRILNSWQNSDAAVSELPYSTNVSACLPDIDGVALVDVSGLTKPLIFMAVRRELLLKGRVIICHAMAEKYYPLQEDLGALATGSQPEDPLTFLEALSNVLKGESGPYSDIRLLDDTSDPTRSRVLLAFASAKHERLFSLLDRRDFDSIEIIAPSRNEPRDIVAQFAAEFLKQNYPNTEVTKIDTNDLLGLIDYLDERFLDVYAYGGADLELGLTGSKTQAVASAILSSRRRIAQAWYLSPQSFDEKRFSSGVGEIRLFDVRISDE